VAVRFYVESTESRYVQAKHILPDAKFYFRRGTMHYALDDVESAYIDLKEAHRLQPNDASIAKKLKDVKRCHLLSAHYFCADNM
jgi:hypothetical protein